MKKHFLFLLMAVGLFGWLSSSAGAGQTPAEGGTLPDIRLEAKEDAHRQYLDLKTEASFLVHKLKADVVIIEIFSMY